MQSRAFLQGHVQTRIGFTAAGNARSRQSQGCSGAEKHRNEKTSSEQCSFGRKGLYDFNIDLDFYMDTTVCMCPYACVNVFLMLNCFVCLYPWDDV